MSQKADTLSGQRVEVEKGNIGSTSAGRPYNHIHIGNARAPLFWDVVVRYLRNRGYGVTFVQNITDVEDKIINVKRRIEKRRVCSSVGRRITG